ncbi:unnamed protein product [Clavelina lepadiformis]|uniref:C2H2-type domain-containing protein n=1 Tax=Clavelina lepadiformis TaxID=159417 RepID=A0ABP0FRW1_CLALP
MDSSCDKLFAFTKNFISGESRASGPKVKVERREEVTSSGRDVKRSCRSPQSPVPAKKSKIQMSQENGDSRNVRTQSLKTEVNFEELCDVSKCDEQQQIVKNKQEGVMTSSDFPFLPNHADGLKAMTDAASLNAAQKLLMDAMLRQQKQFYEQCTNSWVNVQRSDNNCLSKSKAERYRWCVQGTNQKTSQAPVSSQSHVSNLKKSATLAGTGVAPVQDKLYSTVFTGASKFHCRDCGSQFNTLVELTVHMNKTGHFRDMNVGEKAKTQEDSNLANVNKAKKKHSLLEEDPQSEKVLTCMGCGHLFESLQDLSVHMMKTKHYENVPSLRMWSQKHDAGNDNNIKKKALPNQAVFPKKHEMGPSFPMDPAAIQQSMYLPSLMGGINNQAAAYASLLYSNPWLSASVPPAFFPSVFPGGSGLPYLFGFPPSGMFPGSFTSPPVSTATADDLAKIKCIYCKETFANLQALTEHMKSSLPCLESAYKHGYPGPSNSNLSSLPQNENPMGVSPSPKPGAVLSNVIQNNPKWASRSSSANGSLSNHKSDQSNSPFIQDVKKSDACPAASFDFIKSLESTIQSAISKVEVPKLSKKPQTSTGSLHLYENSTPAFSPFSSSLRSEFSSIEKSTSVASTSNASDKRSVVSSFINSGSSRLKSLSNDVISSSEPQAPGCVSAPAVFLEDPKKRDENLGKVDAPLDLTLKKDTATKSSSSSTSSKASTDMSFHSDSAKNGLSSKLFESSLIPKSSSSNGCEIISAYTGTEPIKNPLQSLHDNMQSLFSYMKPKIEVAMNALPTKSVSPVAPLPCRSSSDFYFSSGVIGSVENASDPLKEIQKIVNSANLETSRSPTNGLPTSKESGNRKISSGSFSLEEQTPKLSSLLNDLVVPRDEAPSFANPIQMMQDLVEKNLNSNSRGGNKRKISSSPPVDLHYAANGSVSSQATNPQKRVEADKGLDERYAITSVASALLSLKSLGSTWPPSSNTSDMPSKRHCAAGQSTNLETAAGTASLHSDCDLSIEQAFITSLPSTSLNISTIVRSLEASEMQITTLARESRQSVDDVKTWLRRQSDEYRSRGRFSFVRATHHSDSLEFICSRCDVTFLKASGLANHVEKHLEDAVSLNGISSNADPSGKDDVTSRDVVMTSPNGNGERIHFQGAMCIGPYSERFRLPSYGTPCVSSATSPIQNGHSPVRNYVTASSPSPDDVIPIKRIRHHPHSRCADEIAKTDDVIQVTS